MQAHHIINTSYYAERHKTLPEPPHLPDGAIVPAFCTIDLD
jgi:hypothetical protein